MQQGIEEDVGGGCAITGAAAPVSVFGRAASHQACMLLVSIFKSAVVSYVCKGTHYFSDHIFNPLPLSRAPPGALFLLIVLQFEFLALNHKNFVVGIYGISLEFRTFTNQLTMR